MKTTEYTVFSQYTDGYKQGQSYIDVTATTNRLKELLKQDNVKAPYDSYSVRVSAKNNYGRDALKFRVYFGNSKPLQTFVQSDNTGALDIDKLLQEAHEFHEALMRRHEDLKKNDAFREERFNHAKSLNEQIKKQGYGFDYRAPLQRILNVPTLTPEQEKKLVDFINTEL